MKIKHDKGKRWDIVKVMSFTKYRMPMIIIFNVQF